MIINDHWLSSLHWFLLSLKSVFYYKLQSCSSIFHVFTKQCLWNAHLWIDFQNWKFHWKYTKYSTWLLIYSDTSRYVDDNIMSRKWHMMSALLIGYVIFNGGVNHKLKSRLRRMSHDDIDYVVYSNITDFRMHQTDWFRVCFWNCS